ncbi:omptin family outer membrane protease [Escherichia fergusonii]|uniref:omptin family outer membrane protease n=1 Tax=Escherichia fergusonii TaxID=564 RepID=UPI000F66D7EA|nr:omptin family outer membrane protease [Escherichia fergusonii]QCZ32284.1 omptin family outer membrane protease [Escherichia fergusonii]
MMSLWDALRMNMMISYQELVRTFPNNVGDSTYYDNAEGEVAKIKDSVGIQNYNYTIGAGVQYRF